MTTRNKFSLIFFMFRTFDVLFNLIEIALIEIAHICIRMCIHWNVLSSAKKFPSTVLSPFLLLLVSFDMAIFRKHKLSVGLFIRR